MIAALAICSAEDETDYSYLEDMAVKDLKALWDVLVEILGDEYFEDATITEEESDSR